MTPRWSSSSRGSACRGRAPGPCSSPWEPPIAMTTEDPIAELLAVLQLADGLFPAGGFAHSLGLETYAQAGAVRDAAGVEALVAAQLEGNAGPADAAAVACAARLAVAGVLDGCRGGGGRLGAVRRVAGFVGAEGM